MRRLAWVVALACSLGCGQTIRPQTSVTTDSNWKEFVTPGKVPAGMKGVTLCESGRVVVHFDEDLPEPLRVEFWQHERVHVETLSEAMRAGETCDQAHQRIVSDPRLLVPNEAQAYCTQLRWYTKHYPLNDPLAALVNMAQGLAEYYARLNDPKWHIPSPIIVALFVRTCADMVET